MAIRARPFENSLVLSIFAAAFLAGAAYGQEAQQEPLQPPSRPSAGAMKQGDTGLMMAERKKMMAEMQASEKKLDELIAKMNAIHGSDKVDQIAAVVNELVAQHKRMHSGMMSMPGGMMERMQMGPQPKEGAATPPSSDKPEVDHQQHH